MRQRTARGKQREAMWWQRSENSNEKKLAIAQWRKKQRRKTSNEIKQ